jgi:hypothetical protein
MDWVYALYIINALMVATDMCLCLYYKKRLEKQSEKEG